VSGLRGMAAAPTPVPVCEDPEVREGPWLLEGVEEGPGLAPHRKRYGETPRRTLDQLIDAVEDVGLRGRGGAAFPFATKLRAAADRGGRPCVVVNLSEGEPASSKDTVLARLRPHLVLDGAVMTARALGARQVHVALPGERPLTVAGMDAALAQRRDRGIRFVRHVTEPRFVAGQARAVLELMAGRPNLPVTAWSPEAVTGHRARPTLLSNAETWAHVGRLLLDGAPRGLGTDDEPGTTLLTVRAGGRVTVRETEYGESLSRVVSLEASPAVLLGGYHGTWVDPDDARTLVFSVPGLRTAGYALGAGLVMAVEGCPVGWTRRLVDYLAAQSAGRCGPCRNGLPALADALTRLDGGTDRVVELAGTVERRGACAHPDGMVRLVRSLLAAYPDEVEGHVAGCCTWRPAYADRRIRRVAS